MSKFVKCQISYRLRTSFFVQNKITEEERIFLENIQEAFVAYFTSHNVAKNLDFDGSGYNSQSREFNFSEDSLIE